MANMVGDGPGGQAPVFLGRQSHLERLGYPAGQLLLQIEHVFQGAGVLGQGEDLVG